MTGALRRTWLAASVASVACSMIGCGGASAGGVRGCPGGVSFCAVFVANECSQTSGAATCQHRPLVGLEELDVVPLHTGVADLEGTIRLESDGGVFSASLPPGVSAGRGSPSLTDEGRR